MEEFSDQIKASLLSEKNRDESPPSSSQSEINESEENSPIKEVALTVSTTDDPSLPVLTFRMWFLGTLSCVLLSFLNQFFWYRTEPLSITAISAQIAVVPLGQLMAAKITNRVFFKGTRWEFSLNPGPFNVKEHVLITIFANSGAGTVYAIHVVTAVKVLGFGWAGIFRRYLVEPAAMCPWFATANVAAGFFLVMYVVTPLSYWFNIYQAKNFPIFSDDLFTTSGQIYNISSIIDSNFHLDNAAYERQGPLHLSTFFAMAYGIGFAALSATVMHVILFHGREIWEQSKSSFKEKKMDIHTKLMSKYRQVPEWWFWCILAANIALTVFACEYYKDQLQLPWWGVILACVIAIFFTLPIGIITAITNQVVGTLIAGFVYLGTAWWLMETIPGICESSSDVWTCPGDHVFYDASVIWGLIGPRKIFGDEGTYGMVNWFFLGGAVAPVLVWLATKAFPNQEWIRLINMPVLIGACGMMPPATAVNYTTWIIVGFLSGYVVYRYRPDLWQRHNYVLSGALDAGLAFMGVVLYLCLGLENKSIDWWGNDLDACPYASCPTAKGIAFQGCPVIS
ncbi:hypothetical protein DH2020_002059 [Rehmannia glutinosa]|uniref:Uncharacterized protein n=1 Tax=Rehmannia glutinosa TaxID=99300 RepID=A0ABR0XT10_REHGL